MLFQGAEPFFDGLTLKLLPRHFQAVQTRRPQTYRRAAPEVWVQIALPQIRRFSQMHVRVDYFVFAMAHNKTSFLSVKLAASPAFPDESGRGNPAPPAAR